MKKFLTLVVASAVLLFPACGGTSEPEVTPPAADEAMQPTVNTPEVPAESSNLEESNLDNALKELDMVE